MTSLRSTKCICKAKLIITEAVQLRNLAWSGWRLLDKSICVLWPSDKHDIFRVSGTSSARATWCHSCLPTIVQYHGTLYILQILFDISWLRSILDRMAIRFQFLGRLDRKVYWNKCWTSKWSSNSPSQTFKLYYV